MILLPLLLSAACGIQTAEICVRAAVQQHKCQATLVPASHAVEWQSMPTVDPKRLPVVYVDGVPWSGDRGKFQAGPLRVPGMGTGYGFVHETAEGRVSGVFVGRFDHAVVSGRRGEELQFQPLASQQASMIPGCDLALQGRVGPPVASVVTPPPMERPACGIRPLTLAVESDLQFYQRFGDVGRATVWLTLGVLQAQHALRRDLSVELEVPYMGLHISEDPWSVPDVEGSAGSMLHEFRTLWPGLAPVSTQLSHFVSGVGNGLSLAGQSGICDPAESYAVHTSRLDSNHEPDGRIFSLALLHGLGHNLGARHADWYCPPLDTCSTPATNSDCPGFRDCSSTGTIMGSCHLCPGGLDRVEARFHPVNVATMQARMEACLPHRSPVFAGGPSSREPGEPWAIHLETRLTLMGNPRLQFWGDSVAGEVPMTPQGDGAFLAHVPPASCGQRTYAQVVLETVNCGTVVWPEPGLQPPMETLTMEQLPALVDDMSVNRGWISLQNGASRGFWTRAIPIADPGWTIAPATDAGGDGWCFVTGNYWGNSDVDDGRVEVISPPIPVESGPLQVEFDYYLGLVNENGEDRLTLQMSWSGLQGPWTSVWRTGFDTNGAWTHVQLTEEYLARWPRDLPGNLYLRFLARDGSPPSVVEAAIDGVVVSTGQCP